MRPQQRLIHADAVFLRFQRVLTTQFAQPAGRPGSRQHPPWPIRMIASPKIEMLLHNNFQIGIWHREPRSAALRRRTAKTKRATHLREWP